MIIILFFNTFLPILFGNYEHGKRSHGLFRESWELVWSDEFDYEGLPNENKWSYESGFVRGVEKQYYTSKRSENAYVKNGFLTIVAKKESYKNPLYKGNIHSDLKYQFEHLDSIPLFVRNTTDSLIHFTSASLNTLGKASWRYGKIEVRAKMPKGSGVWPAIWMMGESREEVGWPKCGEIDIVEFLGRKPEEFYSSVHHLDDQTGRKKSYSFINKLKRPPYRSFHKYSLEWNEKEIVFFYDNVKYLSVENNSDDFKKPFYLLINLALGGKFGGELDEGILPQKFVIDYVRVYQQSR